MPRLFTALEVPAAVAQNLSMLRGGLPGARWIEPSDYHVTLRFLGDIDDAQAHDVALELDSIRRPPISVTIESLSAFGGSRPRAIVALVRSTNELEALQADHERAARRAGLSPEPRKFTPHVTLARLRSSGSFGVAEYLTTRGLFTQRSYDIDRFLLYSSRASTGGGPYLVEAEYPLDEPDLTV